MMIGEQETWAASPFLNRLWKWNSSMLYPPHSNNSDSITLEVSGVVFGKKTILGLEMEVELDLDVVLVETWSGGIIRLIGLV